MNYTFTLQSSGALSLFFLYNDYARYIELYNLDFANKRRKLYLNRHKKGIDIINSKQYLSSRILW